MRRLVLCSGLVALVLVAWCAYVEPRWVQVRHVYVSDADVPAAFDGMTIAFLSDIHHGPFLAVDRVRRVVDQANSLRPDLVVLGGDYVYRNPRYIAPCFAELARLEAPLGVLGVLGNHDHWEDAELTRRCMSEAGIASLDNAGIWVLQGGERIRIGGVGDLWTDRQDLEAALGEAIGGDFVVLLSHNPDYAEQLQTDDVDLMLSGHTHGGQVTLFGLWAPFVPSEYGQKYRSGVVLSPWTTVVISNGIGTITPALRFWARPQIVLVHLRRAE